MSEKPLQCEIVTPESLMYSHEAEFVVVPATGGEMGMYYMHAPTICTIDKGCVRITPADEGQEIRLAISGGYVEVDGEKLIVLADRAINMDEVDIDEVNETISKLEDEVSAYAEDDENGFAARFDLEWNKLLLHISENS